MAFDKTSGLDDLCNASSDFLSPLQAFDRLNEVIWRSPVPKDVSDLIARKKREIEQEQDVIIQYAMVLGYVYIVEKHTRSYSSARG